MTLIVSITKLITLSSITIQILQLNNLVFSNSYPFRERLSLIFAAKLIPQKDTTSPKIQKCFKKNAFLFKIGASVDFCVLFYFNSAILIYRNPPKLFSLGIPFKM